MAGKVQARREALRIKLIEIAEARIAEAGLDALRARDLAQEADCAVGAIYNVFADLRDLIMAVNGRTFQALGKHVAQALQGHEGDSPTDRLIVMSHAYLDFASTHPQRWRALFDVQMSTETQVPDWYLGELERLFSHIARPVSECFPDMSSDDVALMTRALFSSVHGIVLLGLERRISGVPQDQLRRMIALVLTQATRGGA